MDVYFNELSTDASFVKLAANKEDAKDILYTFIKTCISYMLAIGVEKKSVMRLYDNITPLTAQLLSTNHKVKELLIELYKEDRISYIEKSKFQLFINDSFAKVWDIKYTFEGVQVFGIGKAKEDETYVMSFETEFKEGVYDWSHSQYQIQKVSQDGTITFDFERNVASPMHVFQKYKIWENCKSKLIKPENGLLPNSRFSDVVPIAYNFKSWYDFYKNHQILDRTQRLKMAKILAVINGWEDIGKKRDNQWTSRDTYKAGKYYLQVDTKHDAFEVYKGSDNHLGELMFNSNKIKTKKSDSSRYIRFVK